MAPKPSKSTPTGELLVCRNPAALKNYDIQERLEVGLCLTGSEVKSLRARRATIEAAYANVVGTELFLHGMHIAPYEQAGPFGHEPKRPRKLLAHRREIERLGGRLTMSGYTLVPLRVYFRKGRAKLELGLGKGRARHDRRQEIRKTQDLKEARAAMSRLKR